MIEVDSYVILLQCGASSGTECIQPVKPVLAQQPGSNCIAAKFCSGMSRPPSGAELWLCQNHFRCTWLCTYCIERVKRACEVALQVFLVEPSLQANSYFMWCSNAVPTLTYSLLASRLHFHLTQQYLFNPETGSFRHHRHHVSRDRRWLSSISYDSGDMVYPRSVENPPPSFEVTTTANTCIYFYDDFLKLKVVFSFRICC